MKKTLPLFNDEIAVDTQKFLDGKLLLQANTGGGKSWATRRIIEQFAGVIPQIILDPEGEFFTLRQKYPDFILIGKGQEITADPKSAGLLAHKLIEERVSCIIDLLEMSSHDRDLFVKNFVQAMINAPRNLWLPTLLTIDEAQIFAPESGQSETAGVLKDAGFRFRKRHFGLILATPRISELSKSVASTCKNKLIGQASQDIDIKRSAAELGFATKEDIASIRDLDPGEFYGYGPAFSKRVIRLKIGKTLTQHGDSANVSAKVAKPSPKVQKALAVLAAVPQAAEKEAKTIQGLETELRAAQGQIRALETKSVLAKAAPGLAGYQADPKTVEKAIKARDAQWKSLLLDWREMAYQLAAALEMVQKATDRVPDLEYPDMEPEAASVSRVTGNTIKIDPAHERAAPRELALTLPVAAMDRSLGSGEIAVLNAIAQVPEGITTEYIALLTGYKQTSRRVYSNTLVRGGFAEKVGELFRITDLGTETLGSSFRPLPQGRALLDHWLATLPEGERKILSVVHECGGQATREYVGSVTNYKTTSLRVYTNNLVTRNAVRVDRENIYLSDDLR